MNGIHKNIYVYIYIYIYIYINRETGILCALSGPPPRPGLSRFFPHIVSWCIFGSLTRIVEPFVMTSLDGFL